MGLISLAYADINDVIVYGGSYGIYSSGVTNTQIRDVKMYETTYKLRLYAISTDICLVNCYFDIMTINWVPICSGDALLQYTWDILIKDNLGVPIQNANVTLIRNDGTPAFTALTAADGTIAEQTVTRGYYAQATGNTLNDYGPFTLEVIPPSGPLMKYIHKGIILDGPVDWEITLSPPPPAISKLVREFKPEEPPVPLEFVMSVEKLIRSHTKTKIGG